MKYAVLILVLLHGFYAWSQGSLINVSAEADMSGTDIWMQQEFTVQLPDSVQSIALKALQFEGVALSAISIRSETEPLTYKTQKTKGLHHILLPLNLKEKTQSFKVRYKIQVQKELFYVPLFFTDLSAASSDNTFFKMDIKLPKEQPYHLYFPSLVTTEKSEGDLKRISFQLPALPSVLRMALPLEGGKKISFANKVDGAVALLFLGIGYLIWRNRKRLAYA